ncbi:MAG: Fur family transcriptional regulator [Candidatus Margulisiibacteriota bacterium]
MKSPHKIFEEFLSTHEGRYTAQKRLIAEEIFKVKHHFEIDAFISRLYTENKKLSRATVYRTVKQLLDAGLLQKISTRDGKVYYERKIGNKEHDHLICNTCGKILEIKDDIIAAHLEELCKRIEFHPEYRSLHIYGQCQKCHKKHDK